MSLKALIIPDKFKGTLTAEKVAQAIAAGWRKARPDDEVESLPMSDGGDGFGEVMSRLLRARPQTIRTVDAAHRPCRAAWWWDAETKTAIVESAKVIGLAQLPPGKFHPFDLDTRSLGAVLRAAAKRGAKRCLIGIGGSATNDGGFGMARALGWKFFDADGKPIERWTELAALARIERPREHRLFAEPIVAVDVQNPLLGPRGASRVYGPQKGLREEDFTPAEACLRRLAKVAKDQLHLDFARTPGAGAAGGLGFGLMTFVGARPEGGFDLFARHAQLRKQLKRADLVITGEGTIDRSTLMGKGVGEIARLCRKLKMPCIGFAGTVKERERARQLFVDVRGLTDLTSPANAMKQPERWLERLARETAERISRGKTPR